MHIPPKEFMNGQTPNGLLEEKSQSPAGDQIRECDGAWMTMLCMFVWVFVGVTVYESLPVLCVWPNTRPWFSGPSVYVC